MTKDLAQDCSAQTRGLFSCKSEGIEVLIKDPILVSGFPAEDYFETLPHLLHVKELRILEMLFKIIHA